MFELFIDNKKDLHIAENPLFKGLKYLNFSFGTPSIDHLELLVVCMTTSKITQKISKMYYKI